MITNGSSIIDAIRLTAVRANMSIFRDVRNSLYLKKANNNVELKNKLNTSNKALYTAIPLSILQLTGDCKFHSSIELFKVKYLSFK